MTSLDSRHINFGFSNKDKIKLELEFVLNMAFTNFSDQKFIICEINLSVFKLVRLGEDINNNWLRSILVSWLLAPPSSCHITSKMKINTLR